MPPGRRTSRIWSPRFRVRRDGIGSHGVLRWPDAVRPGSVRGGSAVRACASLIGCVLNGTGIRRTGIRRPVAHRVPVNGSEDRHHPAGNARGATTGICNRVRDQRRLAGRRRHHRPAAKGKHCYHRAGEDTPPPIDRCGQCPLRPPHGTETNAAFSRTRGATYPHIPGSRSKDVEYPPDYGISIPVPKTLIGRHAGSPTPVVHTTKFTGDRHRTTQPHPEKYGGASNDQHGRRSNRRLPDHHLPR